MRTWILAAAGLAALALAACGGGGSSGYGGGGGGTTPGVPTATHAPVAPTTIGIGLPTGLGTETDPTWGGPVGGFTEASYSQVLAFPVGTTVTIMNLASSTAHTLNVIGSAAAPPASFPGSPALPTTASGGALGTGYSSGSIAGGGSVTVTLSNPGTFLIGCAFHYASNQMRDVIEVSNTATPGPQATPPPTTGGGTGCGAYC